MSSAERRAAARRRAWGRGPIILRFEPLEGRPLLSARMLPDLVGSAFDTSHNLDWGDSFQATGQVKNQGKTAVPTAFNVGIYASSSPGIGPRAVLLGEATIPAGLQPGATASYNQNVQLPNSPLPGVGSNGRIFIDVKIDPENAVAETNKRNNSGVGVGFDISVVTITPPQPSNLVGSSFGVTPSQASWGSSITVTAQIKNNAQGNAPATRARIVLTPAGVAPGGPSDVTIGSIDVPAVPAWQTTNVQQTITLPAIPPLTLGSATSFTVSMVQDADYQTNPTYPHTATQGAGLDSTTLTIQNGLYSTNTRGPLPDLAVGSVQAPSQPIAWGGSFQVSANVQNLGQGAVGPFQADFILVGPSGDISHGLFLGEATGTPLASGGSEQLVQTLKLPSRVPSGLNLPSATVGRIAVLLDPENTIDEQLKSNNDAVSNPIVLRVLGTDGSSSVPNAPAIAASATPSPALPGPQVNGPRRTPRGKLYRHVTTPSNTVGHQLKLFPDRVAHFVKDVWNLKL